ncbi:MAG TPA: energy transducer TonB [Thermoanaerobaculia bacterium]|nr:energy transducer TonB [Thermoanaerobaculia bacterium]
MPMSVLALVVACTVSTIVDPDALVGNEPVFSANGRYAAVVRWHDGVPDFGKARERDLQPRDSTSVDVGWYAVDARGRTLFREIPLERGSFTTVLPSDSGRYLVALQDVHRGCSTRSDENDPLVTIYGADGALVARVNAGDAFEPFDLKHLSFSVDFALRTESDGREVVAITVPVKRRSETFRIDVATGALLDGKHPIFPRPHVDVSVADPPSRVELPADCQAWQPADILDVDSGELLASASYAPMPEYPAVAVRARLGGVVPLRFLIDESGEVVCAAATPFPFGIGEAVTTAARRWRFAPFTVHGRATKATGELLVHFELPKE